MASQLSKKRRGTCRGWLSGVEVRVTLMRTEIIIRATRTQNVLGEKGRRIRELISLVQKRFKFPEPVASPPSQHRPRRLFSVQNPNSHESFNSFYNISSHQFNLHLKSKSTYIINMSSEIEVEETPDHPPAGTGNGEIAGGAATAYGDMEKLRKLVEFEGCSVTKPVE
ncbi:putative K domain, type 2, K domain superfamily, prokaryotic type, K domain-like, alpha/beta protein [Helianthus debilis subsp. tardiflorus]